MARSIRVADCVRLRGSRIGRVRATLGTQVRVRVRRATSKTHQFVLLSAGEVKPITCPKGWMSPQGYARYLRVTLAKMRQRKAQEARSRRR